MLVTSRQSCPRRISAFSKKGVMSTLAHQAIVTPTAKAPTPAITGYFGISVHLGKLAMIAPTFASFATQADVDTSASFLRRISFVDNIFQIIRLARLDNQQNLHNAY